MKKVLLFIVCLFLSITSINALDLDFYSKNIILYNYDRDEVIYEEKADEVVSIASMTKIMTSLVLIENIDNLDKKVVLEDKHFAGLKEAYASLAGFRLGQTVTYRDLLSGILIPSGADAVQTLAIEVFGSNEILVEKMNEKARELNLQSTHFANPFGLDDDEHYSTVREVSIILKEALKNDLFKEIYTTRKYLTSDLSITFYSTIVEPLNMLNQSAPFIKGSKTGFTGKAGRCLSSLAYDEENDIYYLMITTGAKERVEPVLDAINTYEYIFDNYSNHIVFKQGDIAKEVSTTFAKEKKVNLMISEDIIIFHENDSYDESKLTYTYNVPNRITKILKDGSKVGTLTVFYDGNEVKTIDLVLDGDMHFSIVRLIFKVFIPLGILMIICILIFKERK